MNKYFFVIYCEDSNLSTILDGIKLIANPEQGSKTHMTVRGPYTSRNNLGHFHKSWNNVIHGENIEIEGIDKFFNQNQNTVFFRCQETEKLKSIWKKFNYNEFHPHITIYDGKDRDFAEDIYKILNENGISFSFKADSLGILKSIENGSKNLFTLKSTIDYSYLSQLLGKSITYDSIKSLDNINRLVLIKSLCRKLKTQIEVETPTNNMASI